MLQNAPTTTPAPVAGTPSSPSSKRKRATEPKFYAVRVGHKPGVYYSWPDCLSQVKGFKQATFKSFTSLSDAESFVAGRDPTHTPKFYAVQNGRVPGIYTDWPTAQKQITGWTKPKHRCFSTRAEAEAFLHAAEANDLMPSTTSAEKVDEVPNKFQDTFTVPDRSNAAPARKKQKSAVEILPSNHGSLVDLRPAVNGGVSLSAGTYLGTANRFDPSALLDPRTGKAVRGPEPERQQVPPPRVRNPREDHPLTIYTDGSSLGNGQRGAVAGVGVFFGPSDPLNLSEALIGPRQTNQRAELTAILRALELAPLQREAIVFSDSAYSIKCVTEWFVAWRRNEWRNSSGKAVENRDLVEGILARIEERRRVGGKTSFQWLKGHANHPGNVEADKLAVAGAARAKASGQVR